MEYNNAWYRRVEYVCLVFAVILQLVTLASPGWRIVFYRHSEGYLGIFYQTECQRTTCQTRSLYHIYDHTVPLKDGDKAARLKIDEEYHERIKQQVYMLVILASSLITTIVQYYKLKHKESNFPRLTAVCIPCIALVCGLMVSIIVDEFLWIDKMMELRDIRENRYIGFPYCLATYVAAFVALVLVNYLYMVEMCKFVHKPPAPPSTITPDYEFEKPISVESSVPVEKPISVIPMTNGSYVPDGIDNKIVDVRL